MQACLGIRGGLRTCTRGSGGPQRIAALRCSSACALRSSQASQPWATSSSTARRRVAATAAAATAAAAAAAPDASLPAANPRPPLLPPWANSLVRVAGAAAMFALWYNMSATVSGPFASMSLSAAVPVRDEGIRTAVRSAWAGLAAGCLHTLAGADHLAALTPLTIGRSQFKASLLGALWGFGHSTGQLILGLLMVVLKDRFQQLVPALDKWGGATVGLTLLAIGTMGMYETYFEQHAEEEAPAEQEATSDGSVGVEMQGGVLVAKKERGGFGLATFATGIVYGLQPDALFVIVPALALPTKLAAAAYILMFVFGTVAAMGAYTGVIGATSAAIKKSNSGLTKKLSGFASAAALALGATMLLGGFGLELPFSLPFGHSD
ncbi:hypothetical protein D9Q98_004797 [Chlorella vulgaris]|uniref:Chloroplast zebra-necrosis protein n=1 Tax=Chlorella vulgaris TaxID=3077 RepID=A0A9D4TQP2_CHLVU|nr:hypothetical protein D9Q98_004797 [Chlorella vulgaris]